MLYTRTEIPQIIDGTHPTAGRTVAVLHQTLIVISALTISIETIPDLPPRVLTGLIWFELAVLLTFLAEYITRIYCARRPLHYVFSFWGIVDLLACVPIIAFLNPTYEAFSIIRLLRLVRLLKLMHTNRALNRLEMALQQSRGELAVFAFLASIMLYVAAVGIYIFEHEAQPDKFSSIPMCLWWAVVSFTTVGYGDLYPITPGGRFFTGALLFIGLGVISVPSAIITTALVRTDVSETIVREVEEDMRGEIEAGLRKDAAALKRKPKRRNQR